MLALMGPGHRRDMRSVTSKEANFFPAREARNSCRSWVARSRESQGLLQGNCCMVICRRLDKLTGAMAKCGCAAKITLSSLLSGCCPTVQKPHLSLFLFE